MAWDAYLGADALEDSGVAVGISSWRQRSNNAIPPAVKATASYMNSILAKMEAKASYAEAIMLNEAGACLRGTGRTCSSCATACFPRRRFSDGLLGGITRDTVLSGRRPGIPAVGGSLTRSDLYRR